MAKSHSHTSPILTWLAKGHVDHEGDYVDHEGDYVDYEGPR